MVRYMFIGTASVSKDKRIGFLGFGFGFFVRISLDLTLLHQGLGVATNQASLGYGSIRIKKGLLVSVLLATNQGSGTNYCYKSGLKGYGQFRGIGV